MKNWWRKLWRDKTVRDLRLIRPRFRSIYRKRFLNGGLGTKIGLLIQAYNAGHFYLNAYLTPAEKSRIV